MSTTSAESDGNISNLIPTPPDGGWGWVIVAASLVCNIIVDGIGYSFGIFLPEFVRYFDSPRSKVSLVGSLLCGTYLCAGKFIPSEPAAFVQRLPSVFQTPLYRVNQRRLYNDYPTCSERSKALGSRCTNVAPLK